MPASSPATILRDAIRTAVQGATVATAAGIASATWAAAVNSGGHVFDGEGGFVGSRNRGRLPFIELWVQSSGEDQLSYEAGVSDNTIMIRAHIGGVDQSQADLDAGEILFACVRAIRSMAGDRGRIGSTTYSQTNLGPWGTQREVSLTIQLAIEV